MLVPRLTPQQTAGRAVASLPVQRDQAKRQGGEEGPGPAKLRRLSPLAGGGGSTRQEDAGGGQTQRVGEEAGTSQDRCPFLLPSPSLIVR
eukprot:13751-Hanusia_phi.AAC.1